MNILRKNYSFRGLTLLSIVALPVHAATFEVTPAVNPDGTPACTADEAFENVANTLQPGDELVVRGGTYCNTGRRFISVSGTAAAPIVIRAADGEVPVLTRADDPTGPQTQNGIEIFAEHTTIRGIRFERGDAGVRFFGGSQHVTFEDNEISFTSNNGLTLNSGSTSNFVIRRNHIHDTGQFAGDTEGEGMYVGCHTGSCSASNHLIEGNYIHHLRGTSSGGNDGIEIKTGSFANTVRDNVIHDTTIGRRYPCIFAYGVDDPLTQAPNVIERNVVWNCGEAILVTADVIVRNNIVLDSDFGINVNYQNPAPPMRNVTLINNTIAGAFSQALRLRWSGGADLTVAGNAIYNPGGTAVSGLPGAATLVANVVEGAAPASAGFITSGNLTVDFNDPGNRDYWPQQGGALIGAADPGSLPADDFNADPRPRTTDVGAYETAGRTDNPGWRITEDFKMLSGDPTVPNPPRIIEE